MRLTVSVCCSQFVSDPWYEIRAFAVPGVHDAALSLGCTRWHFAKSDDGLGLHARLAYRGRWVGFKYPKSIPFWSILVSVCCN